MILDKLIIHLKNVLFFKAVIYIFLIIGLISLNPVANNELRELLQKRDNARLLLEQANLKVESIHDFENKIVDVNTKYKELEIINKKKGCRDRSLFIYGLKEFVAKSENRDNLDELQISIKEVNKLALEYRESDNLRVKPYEGIIKVKAINYTEFFKFLYHITNTLPMGSLIIKCEIENQQTLTPNIINDLVENKRPLLFYGTITVLFREINYD